ncbi:MAG: hypothetical protein AB1631_10670 [Acidobacteriota bacterium]
MKSRFLLVALLITSVVFAQTSRTEFEIIFHNEDEEKIMSEIGKTDFEVIEGIFHDGLGTFAELSLANELITLAQLDQPPFDTSRAEAKMKDAIGRLPPQHTARTIFQREITNIKSAAKKGAAALLDFIKPARLLRVHHTAREFSNARAGDIRLECEGRAALPVSVKTDKSGKVAVSEGQTPDIAEKWAERYFRVSPGELEAMIKELGFSSRADLKSNYLNVSRLVAEILIRKLGLEGASLTDFSRARVTNLEAAKYLFRQLLRFKHGDDESHVIIFDRLTAEVKWESVLEGIDIDSLTADRISLRPSRPRGHPIASEFGIKVDGRAVVSFQIKHKRGASRGTARQYQFSDITTRLMI